MTFSWLPELVETDGDWDIVLTRLYKIFKQDFIINKCFYDEKVVSWDKRKLDSKYDEGFWHLISKKNPISEDRLFDSKRARKLPWCRPCIENCINEYERLRVWENKEKGRTQVYIWLEDLDYVIILQNKIKYYFLITAYHVEGDRTRKQLRDKYDRRLS
jgi:hypothetical protein